MSGLSLKLDSFTRRIVLPLAIAETLVWAGFYYIFPALLPEWESDPGWSKTMLSMAFTLSLVITALLFPLSGRLIDRGHSTKVLTGSAFLGAVLLIVLSQVTRPWQFWWVWAGLGIAMAGCLYDPCFAVLVRANGKRAKRAISLVTIFAGFAGTIAFPSARILTESIGWRAALWVFAAAICLVALPLFRFASRHAEAHALIDVAPPDPRTKGFAALKDLRFHLLAVAVFCSSLDHGMLISHILPIFESRRASVDIATLAASFIGPMQVVARMTLMQSDRFARTSTITTIAFTLLAAAALSLLHAGATPWLIAAFVVMHGAGIGIASVMRPVATAELMGRRNFGVVAGVIGMTGMTGYALGPILSAVVWEAGGYDRVIALAFAIALISIVSIIAAWRIDAKKGASTGSDGAS
ncbi:MFS transporter [Thioalkalivibrio sp. HK1]|uniref:MFS transporter n=1 Tax=Thioalkalivibrio sp. HK1 TaxID=1469245 RepID=UPI00046ED01F|nr:MFS transporter [Thioalkalivibrio sp. HK1]